VLRAPRRPLPAARPQLRPVLGRFTMAVQGQKGWEQAWKSQHPKSSYDVIIVDAGGHGLATAYHLEREHGIKNIAVLEKGYLGGGNAARNTTIVRSNYLWDEAAKL
jgi:sarcosine oxidase subunit beta